MAKEEALIRDRMREPLKKYMETEEDEALREALREYAVLNYKPLHSPHWYLEFMNRQACDFTVQHGQSTNHPYYWGLFTIVSQHVYGDCIEECLDKALAIEEGKNVRD